MLFVAPRRGRAPRRRERQEVAGLSRPAACPSVELRAAGCESLRAIAAGLDERGIQVIDRFDPGPLSRPSPMPLPFACLPGRLHCAVPPHVCPAATFRRGMAARNQARRLPDHRPQGRQTGEALQPAQATTLPSVSRPLPSAIRLHRAIENGRPVVGAARASQRL